MVPADDQAPNMSRPLAITLLTGRLDKFVLVFNDFYVSPCWNGSHHESEQRDQTESCAPSWFIPLTLDRSTTIGCRGIWGRMAPIVWTKKKTSCIIHKKQSLKYTTHQFHGMTLPVCQFCLAVSTSRLGKSTANRYLKLPLSLSIRLLSLTFQGDDHIWGLEFTRYVRFSFRGNQTILAEI